MSELPRELQHLRNLIDEAQSDTTIRVLRKLIKAAADEATPAGVIRLAETILECGIEIHAAETN